MAKDSIPGRWWLAGLEKEGWMVIDLTLDSNGDDDPMSSTTMTYENTNLYSIASFTANGAMTGALRDFSSALLSNSSCIYNS